MTFAADFVIEVAVYDNTTAGPPGPIGPVGPPGPAGAGSSLPWAYYYRAGTDIIDPLGNSDVENHWLLDYQSSHNEFSEWTPDKYTYIGAPAGLLRYDINLVMTNSTLTWSSTPTTGIICGTFDFDTGGIDEPNLHFAYGEVPGNKRLPKTKAITGIVDNVVAGAELFTCRQFTDMLGTLTGGTLSFNMYMFISKIGSY